MKKNIYSLIAAALCLIVSSGAYAQSVESDFPDYSTGSEVMTATPGTQGGAVAGMWNPAAWAAMKGDEIAFSWNDRNINDHRMDNWGLFVGGHGLGFAMRRNDLSNLGRIDDYSFSLGGGTRGDYWGLAYGWSRGDTEVMSRDITLTLGNINRPSRYFSIGNALSLGLKQGDVRGISDLGIRPFSTHQLTFFADAAYVMHDNPTTMHWGAGVEVMPLDGVRLAAKISKPAGYSQDKVFSISLGLTLDDVGIHAVPHYDRDSERMSTSYLIRVGELAPRFDIESLIQQRQERVITKKMKGQLTYQTSRWFDENRYAMLDLLTTIDRAKEDKTIDGIALNLSGFDGGREMLWEVREALQDFKSAGKEVYIYIDRAGMSQYYFASVADHLWIDPQGSIVIPGFLAGRTFWKGFFEKVGLGVEEWRYFDYKSAFEGYARREMSEKDREQRLALIEDFYSEWERGITADRKLTPEGLRAMVDSIGFVRPQDALDAGMVDAIGRWDDVEDYIESAKGKKPDFVETYEPMDDRVADPTWGEYPQIAVVYAIGECDMDSGIRGRYTSRLLRKLAKSDAVDAVVLRVDSPGGDPLPSDLVAQEMTSISEQKPMIVSQGGVAASGGYWLSMNADKIYSSPFSITGSIGVIAGWIWDEGLTDKTGFTYDYVKVGAHAELGNGVTLPVLGVTIPDRNLTEYEKGRMEKMIRGLYGEFVDAVATGRELDTAHVATIAQGRVWTGTAALENKLVDELGGLRDAIAHAKQEAGLKKHRRVQIVEYPRPSWIDFNQLFAPSSPIGMLLGTKASSMNNSMSRLDSDYELSLLRRVSAQGGEPVLMISPEDIPAEDER